MLNVPSIGGFPESIDILLSSQSKNNSSLDEDEENKKNVYKNSWIMPVKFVNFLKSRLFFNLFYSF